MTLREFLFLPQNAQYADAGLLLLRCATGVFLIYQSHDNVFSAARMDEFVKFLTHFGFAYPELMAPLSVYAQFLAGIGFILGLFTRFFGAANALEMGFLTWLYWNNGFSRLNRGYEYVLLWGFMCVAIALRGGGPYSLDQKIGREL